MLFDDIQNNSFPEPQSYKASFGKENSSLYKWEAKPLFKEI